MANCRTLKKEISTVCGDLMITSMILKHNGVILESDSDALMVRILKLQDEYLMRAAHIEKHDAARYCKKLRNDFATAAQSLYQDISAHCE